MEVLLLPLIIIGSILALNISLARRQGRSVRLWVFLTIIGFLTIFGWIFVTLILVVTRHTAYLRRDKKMNLMGPEEIEARYRQREDINFYEQWEKEQQQINREALIAELTDISGVSDKIARTLLDQFPTLESITVASAEDLTRIPGVGPDLARAIKARIG